MELSKVVTDIRVNWAISDAKRDEGLTTPEDVLRMDDISYGPYGEENRMDIYMPKGTTKPLPTIVNIHGGAWVYGSKEIYQYYCMALARRGFTVVNMNYRLAPETKFPGALEDINRGLCFVAEHGDDYFADKDNVILVGDSAGAQLASHYATIFTNPEFAKLFAWKLPEITVRVVGLNCGIYNMREVLEKKNVETIEEYLGTVKESFLDNFPKQLDVWNYMNSDFPPAFITTSEHDFLKNYAKPMYEHLHALGVPCELRKYGSLDKPEIAHVFHVNCKLEEAKRCNDEECAFFERFIK